MVVRADLPRGLQGAQLIHAAGESVRFRVSPGTHAVCLVVPGERALRELADRLERVGVPLVRIVESDAPFTGQLTAIGCEPARKEVVGRHLSSIPLLR